MYKQTVGIFFYKRSNSNIIENLRWLKSSEPMKYWKILKCNNKTKTDCCLNDLYEFSKNTN